MASKRGLFRSTTALTAALVTALALAPRTAQAACTDATGPSLRLMTYNASFQLGAPSVIGVIGTVVFGPNPGTGASSDTAETYGMPDSERIPEIVARILKDDPDVFALEEVNKSAAKNQFIALLHDKYPHFIRDVGSNAAVELNNSGLMLFSKFTILANPNVHTGTPPDPSDFGQSQTFISGSPVDSSAVTNVVVFGDSAAPDSWSSKSVAVVKIGNDCDNAAPFTIALTHLQNTYEDHDSFDQGFENHVRLQQFEDIRFAISSSLTSSEMATQPVFLLGDLNVNGMPNAPTFFEAQNGVAVPESHSEWSQTFNGVTPNVQNGPNPSGLFFSCGNGTCNFDKTTNPNGSFMTDSWGFGMPSTDFGQTSPGGATGGNWLNLGPTQGQRLDYVLHNRPASSTTSPSTLCLQYMKRGFDYVASPAASAAGVELSDHMPLLADFNTPAPRCSPFPLSPTPPPAGFLGPLELTWAPLGDPNLPFNYFINNSNNTNSSTLITRKGNMQWYHISADQPGTYTISSTPSVRAAVYKQDDLSREVEPLESCVASTMPGITSPTRDCKYTLPAPPYFIRVFGVHADQTPDRTFSGSYGINFHQHRCRSTTDSCHLEPATPVSVPWPDNAPVNATDTMFFDFVSENTTTGLSPNVTFSMSQTTSSSTTLLTHSVVLADGTTPVAGDSAGSIPMDQTTWSINGTTFSRQMKTVSGGLPGFMQLPAKFFYTVRRLAIGPTFDMTAQFNTDLTYFAPVTLQCIEERTIIGDDDVWGHFVPDGVAALACGGSPLLGSSANPDCVEFDGENWNTNADDEPSTPRAIVAGRVFKSYRDSFNPQIFEDVLDNDDFLFTSSVVGPLESTIAHETPQPLEYVIPGNAGAYDYQLIFQRSHTKPSCSGLANFCPSGTSCAASGHCE
jgi:hypothetical protein